MTESATGAINNNLATAQVRKDTPSVIDVKGIGRPKEFTGREEDFQQWSKKTEAFFAGVIKESEMMLVWAAERPTEIKTTATDLEFLPTDTNEDRGVQNLEFVLQQMHTAFIALTSYGANDISRKNPLEAWRRLQKRYPPTTRGRKRNLVRTIISLGRCSLLELQAGIERWESYVSRNEKKMKDKLDDEIKLAGLESLVPEELEIHLIFTSNRLRAFEDARLEVVTYVEAKFGLRIRDSKPSDTGARGPSDPMDVGAVNSLSSGKGKGSSSPRNGCFLSAVEHISTRLQCTQRHRQAIVWQRQTEQVMEAGLSGLAKSKSDASSDIQESAHACPTDTSWVDGWNGDEWNDGWSFDDGMMTGVLFEGTKVGNKHMTLPQAHFRLEVWMSVPPAARGGLNG